MDELPDPTSDWSDEQRAAHHEESNRVVREFEIAEAVGLGVQDLPGRKLTAEVGAGERLNGWRLA